MIRCWATAALATVAIGVTPAVARADGDPASDVLLTQSLFLPADAGIPTDQADQLAGVLQAAARAGYPIRVALISGPADLGSVTALWRQPQTYAHFLEEELSLNYHGRVLVIMPNGIGLYNSTPITPAERAALATIPAPRTGARLAAGALTAIRRLAAASGHNLPTTPAVSGATASAGANDLVAWIVFVLGGIVIVASWTYSLRARPLRVRERRWPL